ncbi:endonuclease VII domain-containing protein [Micromonospora sonchi]|uniref:endonuclease VII domain-containing protein n=1 Tax=Micromonospora sonchi TaxID=1763543 RepID=UPI001666712A|nr:endonuclease VII domain-containing protein [Micromonospora sonchi]
MSTTCSTRSTPSSRKTPKSSLEAMCKKGVNRAYRGNSDMPRALDDRDGVRRCRDCGETKALEGFPRNRSGRGGYGRYCKPCHNVKGKESKLRLHGGFREYHLRRRYGIGQTEVDELLAEQGGVCAVCGVPDPEHVDHDHRTGWVRGILCFNCNGGLGQFRDSPTRLARAITYLRGTTWQRVLIHPGVYQMCSPTRGRPPSPRS